MTHLLSAGVGAMEGSNGETNGFYDANNDYSRQQVSAQPYYQESHHLPFNQYDWKHLDRSIRDRDVLAFFNHYGKWPSKDELSRFEMDILQSFKRVEPLATASSSTSQHTYNAAQQHTSYVADDHDHGSSDEETTGIPEEGSPQPEITWYKAWDDDDVTYIFDTLLGMLAENRSERVREQVKGRIARSITDHEAALVLIGGDQQRKAIASTIKVNQIRAPPWFIDLPSAEKQRLIHWHCSVYSTKDEAARTFLYRCTSAEEARQKLQREERRRQVQAEVQRLVHTQLLQRQTPKLQWE